MQPIRREVKSFRSIELGCNASNEKAVRKFENFMPAKPPYLS